MFNRDELTEILDSIDLEEWLDDEGVRYRKQRGSRGEQLNVKECPCCGGSNWKVYLNAETGLGNCFSGDCGKTFNKWSFIKAQLGADTRTVIEQLKQRARERGWRPARKIGVAVELAHNELILPESVALPHQGRNMRYLDNRGINASISKYLNLRFSLRGVFQYQNDGKWITQSYANRIIIPIGLGPTSSKINRKPLT